MNTAATSAPAAAKKTRWYRQLYLQVLVAIVLGVIVGTAWPSLGVAMEPIGTTFVTLMKMLIGPIVFLTIVGGIASVADLKKVGPDRDQGADLLPARHDHRDDHGPRRDQHLPPRGRRQRRRQPAQDDR